MGSDAVNKNQKIIVVCGVKNSGKTTLITKLVEQMSREGLKVAVIKHDGHDFACDIEGTDSDRIKKAGAYGTAVFSKHRIFIHKEVKNEKEKELICQFPEADVIFLEGMKESDYMKIEVIRKEISDMPVSNPKGRILIATDWEPEKFQEPAVDLNDIDGILEIIFEVKNQNTESREMTRIGG
ncbi:MAG: molybdopterin-guanine dinucleotide biosynthesis protein B [Dorea sp.]